MNCWALNQATKIRTVGLCHSVQYTAEDLSRDIGVPLEEINYVAAGINHVAFFLRFERNGQDLYPELERVISEGRVPDDNRVRYDLFKRLGYFVTESSEHFAEYVPWYIKRGREDLVKTIQDSPRRVFASLRVSRSPSGRGSDRNCKARTSPSRSAQRRVRFAYHS